MAMSSAIRDKSGTYTKGMLQDGIGLVNLTAYAKLQEGD